MTAAAALLALHGEAVACPTPDSATYDAHRPALLATIPHSTPSCPNPALAHCSPSKVYVPGSGNEGDPDPDSEHLVPPLFLFLPGSGMDPDKHDLILQTAAFAGYRTIGLSYYNLYPIQEQCQQHENPALMDCAEDYQDDCAYLIRMERLSGVDSAATNQVVPVQDSIAARLLEVLGELIAADLADGVSDWGWEQYCVGENHNGFPVGMPLMERIVWENIVVAGFSQGAGYPHLISLMTETDGIVSIDAGNDRCDPGGAELAGYYGALTNSLEVPGGASPGEGEFALVHEQSVPVGMVPPAVVAPSFPYVQLDTEVHDIDTVEPPLTRNVVRTDQSWPPDPLDGSCSAHMSTARDDCIPTEDTWNEPPGTSDVHRAQSPDEMHLFPAFVEGFCNAH